MTFRTLACILVATAALAACGGHGAQDQNSPAPAEASAAASAAPSEASGISGSPVVGPSDEGGPEGGPTEARPSDEGASASPAVANGASPAISAASPGASEAPSIASGEPTAPAAAAPVQTPAASATIVPNLLSFARGTFVRSWTVGSSTYGSEALAIGMAWGTDGTSTATPELVFELPAIAQISQILVEATLPGDTSAELQFAAATANDHEFADAGSIALRTTAGGEATATLQRAITARWLRVRVVRARGVNVRIASLVATGTLALSPPKSLTGRWVVADSVSGAGDTVFAPVKGSIPVGAPPRADYQLATAALDGGFVGATCNYDRSVWRGPVENGLARLSVGGSMAIVANGSILVGIAGGEPIIAHRIASGPLCDLPPAGKGPVMAVLARRPALVDQASDPAYVPGHRFESTFLPLMRPSQLAHASAAMLAMSCTVDADTSASQQRALLNFVRDGHVLVVRDADICSKSTYTFLPYPFTTSATGAGGQRGHVLSIADSSVLGSTDPSDTAHYVDTKAYLANHAQQIGDADIMSTTDQHWCGLMFAKNAKGTSGWIRAYARYGRGIIVYDGFDVDDLAGRVPQSLVLTRLAYGLSPNADLPCNARVASRLLLLSSTRQSVPFGTSRDVKVRFTLDHEGVATPERVALSVDGERARGWHASIDRSNITLGASDQSLVVSVHVPANATPTEHLYTVSATGEGGRVAHASIQLDVNETLAKELEKGRARIYGIHFDIASDRIQPQSEVTIREIAQVLRSHQVWRMRVEGYTDSDGGAAYNLDLSRRRARAVVYDLAAHYHIAAARLKSEGYGLTHPVASNAFEGGKALNRRVELVRL